MNKAEKFWDNRSKHFDSNKKKDTNTPSKTIESIKKHLNKNDKLLDFGCATGSLSIDIADFVKEVYAIDISSKMIEIAKSKKVEHDIANIKFEQTTLFDDRFKNDSFDVITCFNVLHLLQDRQKAIRRINELLKPGGLIISKTPSLKSKKSFMSLLQLVLGKTGIVPNLDMPQISELKNIIGSENFQILGNSNIDQKPLDYYIIAKKI